MEKKRLVAFLLIFLILAFIAYLEKTGYFVKKEVAFVKRVIDGDTFELENGKRVRLLGIEAPEKNEFYFEEATNELKKLVEGKKVLLEKDLVSEDKYGRLLRHVFINGIFVNLHLVENGFANAYFVEPNFKYYSKFLEAEKNAMNRKIGIWKKSESPYSGCIKLVDFKYKKGESVTLENTCNFSINITGWKIKNSEGKSYIFPKIVLKPQRNITLYSDFGVNKGSILYLNKTDFWMDYGDILILRDEKDNLILAYRYS
jgi:micrococcal nuclease